MRVKKFLSWVVVVLGTVSVLGLGALPVSGEERYEEEFEQTESLAMDGKVILRNLSGDIEVKVWDRGEVRIQALKVSRTDSEERARENFSKVTIEILKEGDTLRIETKRDKDYFRKGGNNKSVSVDFWLTIPGRAAADVKSISGNIVMEGLGADAKADSVSGDIDMKSISAGVRAHSVSGDLVITGVGDGVDGESVSGDLEIRQVKGGAELKAVSGDITLEDCEGDVEAESVSGEIEMIDISGADEIMAKSVSGSVKFVGTLMAGGSYRLSSLNGDVTLLIPSRSAFDLYAKTFSGDLNSDFEITMAGKISSKELRGSVNGGGAELNVKTFSGDVYLKKR